MHQRLNKRVARPPCQPPTLPSHWKTCCNKWRPGNWQYPRQLACYESSLERVTPHMECRETHRMRFLLLIRQFLHAERNIVSNSQQVWRKNHATLTVHA